MDTPRTPRGISWYNITMAKQKKKRSKKYSGVDAATTRPSVTRIQAVSRSAAGQWLYERKKLLRGVGIGVVIVIIVIVIITGIISLFR